MVVFRMSVTSAFADGLRRVARARMLISGLWLTTVAMTLPFVLVLRDALADHLGDSLAADTAASAVNFDWWNEFLAQATGLGQTFVPSVIGFAAVMKNLSTVIDRGPLTLSLALLVGANTVVSFFLLGGVLDRLARDRATAGHGFFAACGVFFFRFLRLASLAGAAYGVLFVAVYPWLFDDLYGGLTRNMTVERNAFALRLAFVAVFGAMLLLVNLVFDYAKVRMVVEDRRSGFGALIAAVRFVRRQRGAAIGLYLLNTFLFVLLLAIYFLVAPGAAGSGISVWLGLLIGQLYIIARITVRLTFAATQIALFQGRLAHAGYVARPAARWPDSPAASALSNSAIE